MDLLRGLNQAEEQIRSQVPQEYQQRALDALDAARTRFSNLDTSEADRREATHQRGEDIAAQVHQRIDAAWARVQPMIDHARDIGDTFRSSHPSVPVATPGGGGTGAPLQGSPGTSSSSVSSSTGTKGSQGTATVSSSVNSVSNTGAMSTQTAGPPPPPRPPFSPSRWWS